MSMPIGSMRARRTVDPHPFAARIDHAWRAKNTGIVTRGGAVATWPDSYGTITLSQATSGSRATHATSDSDFGATTGESVTFDGTDDCVISSGSATSRSACAYGIIFKAGASGALRSLFSIGTALTGGGADIRVTAGGNLIFASWDSLANQSGVFFAVTAGTVYRVIANWDPVVSSFAWTLWSSGSSVGTANGQAVVSPVAQTGISRIGCNSTPSQFFNGKIYHVERFNTTFTAPEVATLDAYYSGLLI